MAALEHSFRAMASEVTVQAIGPPALRAGLARRVEDHAERLEGQWSRFRPDSDIDRLNNSGAQPVPVSEETIRLLAHLMAAHRLTTGLFDPSYLRELVASGYGSSVEDPTRTTALPDGPATHAVQGITIGSDQRTVTMPRGLVIDPGGLGKGLAAEWIAADLIQSGAGSALVSVGGDIAVAGEPVPGGWTIGVEHALDLSAPNPRQVLALSLDTGGVATSSTRSRRWASPDAAAHHTIDPRTGQPARTDVASSTVIAGAAWWAEALATAALILGSEPGWRLLTHHQVDGVLQDDRGRTLFTPNLAMSAVDRHFEEVA